MRLSGWLEAPEYQRLLRDVDLLVGLTTEEHVQLSGANEAVGNGCPMVLSDTRTLRELFPRGTVHVPNTRTGLADGLRRALEDIERLRVEVAELRVERLARWTAQAEDVRDRIDGVAADRLAVA